MTVWGDEINTKYSFGLLLSVFPIGYIGMCIIRFMVIAHHNLQPNAKTRSGKEHKESVKKISLHH